MQIDLLFSCFDCLPFFSKRIKHVTTGLFIQFFAYSNMRDISIYTESPCNISTMGLMAVDKVTHRSS